MIQTARLIAPSPPRAATKALAVMAQNGNLPRRADFLGWCLASGSCWLRLRPDGGQAQPYRDSHVNFEEPMDGDHYPCRLGVRYKHDDC
jgi:hypothetical protein